MSQTFVQLLPMIVLLGFMYLFVIRPQQQKRKQHSDLVSNLKKGDKVTTIGGLYGTVSGFKGDKTILLKIAPNVEIEFLRDAISHVRVESKEKSKEEAPKEETKKEEQTESKE